MTTTKLKRACCVLLSTVLMLTGLPLLAIAKEVDSTSETTSAEATTEAASQITDEEIAEVVEAMYASASADTSSQDSSISTVSLLAAVETLSTSTSDDTGIINFSGEDRFETAALQACYAYETSEYVIIANGYNSVDALSATSLAGALKCPILLTTASKLPDATKSAIETLKSTKIIIVGGTSSVSTSVAETLSSYGTVERIYGANRYATQLEIYKYGVEKNLWSNEYVIVASGTAFADALSAAPLAYSQAAPVFLVNGEGLLPDEALDALLKNGGANQAIVVGGEASVSTLTIGELRAVTVAASGESNVERLSGENRYATSAAFATWAVENGLLKWDGVAFATGETMADALAGSVVQGVDGSVLLLVSSNNYSAVYEVPETGITTIKFFGGTSTISQRVRDSAADWVGLKNITVTYRSYAISLSAFVKLELSNNSGYTSSEVTAATNPSKVSEGSAEFYQFAILNDGYSGMTAEQLDAFIDSMVTSSEKSYGVTSTLRGTGKYFVAAAQKYGINEVYLLAHAALESGWGCSTLAQGYAYDGSTTDEDGNSYEAGTYYNFFGIGAYDSSPLSGGRLKALQQGWNSIEAAILGAAEWISINYINSSTYDQNTLYKMKWNVAQAVSSSSVWHQYATSITWATGIAKVMSNFYTYVGLDYLETGLNFEVPQFTS